MNTKQQAETFAEMIRHICDADMKSGLRHILTIADMEYMTRFVERRTQSIPNGWTHTD
ncbi:hypothetical protein UFOVP453_30 [uncultured Caudovirales phage]|uniref:Uncharacterized protein n=1 Tax=uncultured Caudovirales phage TaxID=2100421 RepID=A0A6J5MGV6_9CAUD|nr:hypothetical protein UFOVP453_30 [uncultured Caudovirales phage]